MTIPRGSQHSGAQPIGELGTRFTHMQTGCPGTPALLTRGTRPAWDQGLLRVHLGGMASVKMLVRRPRQELKRSGTIAPTDS
jgi:hypothetical protein